MISKHRVIHQQALILLTPLTFQLDFEEDKEIEVEEVEKLLGQDERNEEESRNDPEDLNSDEIFF